MTSKKIINSTLFVFISFFLSSSFADNYYVAPVYGKTITKADRDSIKELIESSLLDEGQSIVQTLQDSDFWVSSSLVKTGEKYVLVARKKSGKKTIESKKIKFSSIENSDRAVAKVITALVPLQENQMQSVVEKSPLQSSEKRIQELEVDKQPSKAHAPIAVKSRNGGSFGISVLKSFGAAVERGVLHVEGFNLGALHPHISLKTAFDASFIIYNLFDDKDENDNLKQRSLDAFLSLHIGPMFYFMDRNFSPFISLLGGLGTALGASIDDESDWVLGAEFGFAMNRSRAPILAKIKYLSLVNTDLPERPKVLTLAISFAY